MNSFAVIHRPEELPRACNDISTFLSFQYKKEQSTSHNGSIVGIWLDASIEGDLNIEESTIPASRESVGIGGIWSLYWLKPDAVCRLTLVDALLDIAPEDGKASAGFIPIFRHDQPTSEVQSEVDRLWRHYSLYVLPPLWQESGTGRILLPHDYVATKFVGC